MKNCIKFIKQKRNEITHTHTQRLEKSIQNRKKEEKFGEKKSVLKLIAWIQLLYIYLWEKFKRTQMHKKEIKIIMESKVRHSLLKIFHLLLHYPRNRNEKIKKTRKKIEELTKKLNRNIYFIQFLILKK